MSERSVIVMGGGIAGIAAAVRLAEAGAHVTLLETSRRLGGRASSHVDPATGERVDNCQHVLLGCCTNLVDLYQRLGVADRIAWFGDLHFFDKRGHHDVLQADDMPAPLHLSRSMMDFRCLTLGEKLAVSRGMFAMMRLGRAGREKLHDITFEQYLRGRGVGQPDGAIKKFWDVVIVSALNRWSRDAAAPHAIQVFQEGFLAHRDAYRMGVATIPLAELYDAAIPVIERGGGTVEFGASVNSILDDGSRVTGVQLADGRTLTADAYVSALPFDRLAKVASDDLRSRDARLAGLDEFTHSPILGIHLHFAQPVCDHPHMIFVDSPLQWVFNKVDEGDRQYLHGVISAADAWVDKSAETIIAMAVEELAAYCPRAARVELAHARVIKEKRATFASRPGLEPHRPVEAGDTANLLLAGDWTATGWPATMEGAARSGYRAAAALLGGDAPALIDDLPTAPLVRMVQQKPN